jgi:L-lysine cyclodeaminase
VTLILGSEAVADVVTAVGLDTLLDELIAALRDGLDAHDPGQLTTFDRAGFHYTKPDLGLIEWMPALDLGRLVSIKTVGYHPTNPVQRGAPSIIASTALHDTATGRLLALCEATLLTALRTGAASALVSDILAIPAASTLGMIGCGAQAVTQIHAISRIRPIERVVAFDVNDDVAASLPSRLPIPGHVEIEIVDAGGLARLVGESDIVCTATTVGIGDPPVLPDVAHRPWLHINAVGADFPGKRELAPSLLRRATVVPDVVEQCLKEGECQVLALADLGPDLVTLVKDRYAYRSLRDRLTVYDSTGWAVQDLIAAELLLGHAQRIGAGVDIEIQPTPRDPFDPYECVRR